MQDESTVSGIGYIVSGIELGKEKIQRKMQGENSIEYIVSGIELGKEKIQRKLQD